MTGYIDTYSTLTTSHATLQRPSKHNSCSNNLTTGTPYFHSINKWQTHLHSHTRLSCNQYNRFHNRVSDTISQLTQNSIDSVVKMEKSTLCVCTHQVSLKDTAMPEHNLELNSISKFESINDSSIT